MEIAKVTNDGAWSVCGFAASVFKSFQGILLFKSLLAEYFALITDVTQEVFCKKIEIVRLL